jgi:hypothetical protein
VKSARRTPAEQHEGRSPSAASEKSNYFPDNSGSSSPKGSSRNGALPPTQPQPQGDLDPDDNGADYVASNDLFHVKAKVKQPMRPSGSLLSMRGLTKQPGGNQPAVSSHRRDEDSSLPDISTSTAPSDGTSSHDSDEEDIRLLDDLLKTANDKNDDISPLPTRLQSTSSLDAVAMSPKSNKDSDANSAMSEPQPGPTLARIPGGEMTHASKGEGKSPDLRQSMMSNPLSAIWGSMRSRPEATFTPAAPVAPASPHIKLTFRHNSKRFSVTVWHAARFEALRRSCGLSEDTWVVTPVLSTADTQNEVNLTPDVSFVEMLSRCTGWAARGGKSKSRFFLTKG